MVEVVNTKCVVVFCNFSQNICIKPQISRKPIYYLGNAEDIINIE